MTVVVAKKLGQLLEQHNWTVVTAESCTGGGVAEAITSVAGSSAWFEQGFITYSNQAKSALLDVSHELLSNYGAVSEEVVLAMAKGASQKGDVAIAVSGIAGPGGGSLDKPVGTVWIAWSIKERQFTHRYHFEGDRHTIRAQAVFEAINHLNQLINKNTV